MNHGFLIFVLALAVGVVLGAISLNYARRRQFSDLVRAAAAVAGFIVGYVVTYVIAAHAGL